MQAERFHILGQTGNPIQRIMDLFMSMADLKMLYRIARTRRLLPVLNGERVTAYDLPDRAY